MILNITSMFENRNIQTTQYNLKKDDEIFSSSITYEPILKINSINYFSRSYIKDVELLSIKYNKLQNDL